MNIKIQFVAGAEGYFPEKIAHFDASSRCWESLLLGSVCKISALIGNYLTFMGNIWEMKEEICKLTSQCQRDVDADISAKGAIHLPRQPKKKHLRTVCSPELKIFWHLHQHEARDCTCRRCQRSH